jgi:PhoD-like phosphatase
MPELILGPVLRHVGTDEATVWVETDAPCDVEVLGHGEPTFTVERHHYALVCIEGLAPGEVHSYEVRLDGRPVWPPPDYDFPAPAIRTLADAGPRQVVFGSCRVALPHRHPYTLAKDEHPDGREFDALYTLAHELLRRPREDWPDLLLMLGDQVYVDEGSPAVRERIRATRDTSEPPGEEVRSFEEYTWLYHESWGDSTIRWLLSTIPTAMVLDDHDMADDWNISRLWKEEMNREPWWRPRLVGGLMTYWIYQHIGNLAPAELERHEEYEAVRRASDGAAALREFVEWVDWNGEGKVWSFKRDLGATRLIVVDDRTGRRLNEGQRSIFDDHEWDWILDASRGDPNWRRVCTTPRPGTRRSATAPGDAGLQRSARSCAAPRTSTTGPRSTAPSRRSSACCAISAAASVGAHRPPSSCSPAMSTTPTWRRPRSQQARTSEAPSTRRSARRSGMPSMPTSGI